ncbi:MAG TPA: translocation/assembly module TamB domain-containing protein [Kofleriaceae bacterium]|nr:translocation/assembly module TamB domain-containing protein [Kofleriaceae bacterium]
MVAVTAAYGLVRAKFSGPDLADNIATILNKRMRGRIEIGSIDWPSASLQKVLTGGWVPVTIRDVRVWDDCALSAAITAAEGDEIRTGDPNEDCTPDDRPDRNPASRRKPRKLLLRTDRVTAEIDIHALMFGHHDFVFRNLWVHGGEALLEQTREPYPLHAYDHTIVSLVTAFYPRQAPGFRAGITAETPPPIFDLRDMHVAGLNLTLHMAPYSLPAPTQVGYGFTARLEGVDVDAGADPANTSYLYMDPTDPLVAKFYVRLAVAARRGTVRILDEGPRTAFRLPARGAIGGGGAEVYPPPGRTARYQLSLADIKLDRLAQLPAQWARRDFVANSLELELHARTLPCAVPGGPTPEPADGAELHLSGELFSYWDRPYDGAWNLRLDAKNLGPTVRSCIQPMIGGDKLDGTISLTGPFVAQPAVGLDLTGVDVDVPLGKTGEPLRLTLAELHGKIDLVNEEGYIEKTKALVRGGKEPGEIDLSATFGLTPLYSNAQIEIVKSIDVGRFLPRSVGPLGKFLQGRLRAIGDVDQGFELREFDLALGATPTEKALRVYHGRLITKDKFGSIEIENVFADAGRSHAEINGHVYVDKNDMNLRIAGDFPDLDVWLQRFGLPALVKSAGGGVIEIKGPLTRPPTVTVNTTLAGVPCIDQLRLENLVYQGDTIDIQQLSSPGLGGQLTGKGLIRVGGAAPVIERLQLTGSKLDAARLCGLKGVKGTIDELDAEIHGTVDPRRTPLDYLGLGQVYARAEHLSVLDDHYSAISACLNRRDDPRCRTEPVAIEPEDRGACEDGKRAAATGGNGFCVVASARRDAGGTLDATIAQLPAIRLNPRVVQPARLGGVVSLANLPLSLIDELRGQPAAHSVGGLASLTLHLQGLPPPGAPQAHGAVHLLRAWLANGFLGDAQLDVKPTTVAGVAGVEFTGSALAGRLTITGSLGTAAPYPLELAIHGQRVEVDPFLDLQAVLHLPDPVQAWASGTVTLRTELAPARPVEPVVWIELTELSAQVNHRASDGRVIPLIVRVKDQDPQHRVALSVRATPSSYELACRDPAQPGGRAACSAVLETPAGDIAIEGHANRTSVDVTASGPLDLGKLRVLLDPWFDYVAGRVRLAARLSGQFDHPEVTAEIDLDPDQIWTRNEAERQARRDAAAGRGAHREAPILPDEKPVVLRPIGSDTVLTAPRGLIKLANGAIGFTDVLVQVKDDRHSDEQGDLKIAGNIALKGATPVGWSLLLSGRLAGKMLQIALPNLVAFADGLIDIDDQLRLTGTGPQPAVQGSLLFDKQNPLSLIPRGARRELTFRDGKIDIDTSDDQRTYTVEISGVAGTLDDGKLNNITGTVKIQNNELTSAAFRLSADSLPFRIPQTLDLVLSASDVRVTLDDKAAPWRVKGTLRVIDGAYLRNFEITDRIQAIGLNIAPTKPIWDENPALGSAELDLKLDVGLFAVKSNVATIQFQGDNLHIGGSPRDPRLTGQIRVTQGEFHIPGARASFNRTTGSVDFAENQPASNPELHVTSDADYRDLSGQDHVITATISGTLQQLSWDLKTSTGYNKSQTLSLLVLGRSPDQLRRSLGDQNIGTDPTRIDPTTNPSQGFADQIVKDLAGDWVSDLLGSSLTKLTGLDVLRIEIGFGSIGFHAEKKMRDNLRALGDAEQTIRGTTIKLRAELRTPFVVSLQGGYLSQNYYDPAEQDIVDYDVKLVYRLFIP